MIIYKNTYKKVLASSIAILAVAFILPNISYADRAMYDNCISSGKTTRTCQYLLAAPAANSNTNAPQNTPTNNNVSPFLNNSTSNNSSSNSNCGASSNGSVTTLCNPLQGVNSISDLILKFMVIVSYLAVIFGVLMIIWIGLQFVLAQGKPEELKKHREQLLWVIVGIGVILGAKVLVTVVINTLQATGTINSTVINNTSNALKQL